MSKVKSPQIKKSLSLQKDRRNIYGECPTSSRKNIRRGKQRSHMELRREASQTLRALRGLPGNADADAVESQAKVKIIGAGRRAFKKKPDAPLGAVIDRKKTWRARRSKSADAHS
jgi:hypothetical protein